MTNFLQFSPFSLELDMGNSTYLVNGVVPRPDRCNWTFFTQLFTTSTLSATEHFLTTATSFCIRASKLWWTFLNMESSQVKVDFQWVIDQTPFFVFKFSLNIFLAFTATLGNILILIALHKVSSIHPPTKFLLRCLAMTDFCVGVIVQPLFAAFLMGIASGNWRIIYLTLSVFDFTFCGFSFATATAISVDRFLALLLGLRYRHTVTLRRSSQFSSSFALGKLFASRNR